MFYIPPKPEQLVQVGKTNLQPKSEGGGFVWPEGEGGGGFFSRLANRFKHDIKRDWNRDPLRNFGHDVSAEWKGEGMFGGRLPQVNLGLGSYHGRKNAAIIAAIFGGAGAAGLYGGPGAAGAAGAAGPGSAAWVDPFLAGGGSGAWAPVAGAGTASLAAGGAGAAAPVSNAGAGSGIFAKLLGGGGGGSMTGGGWGEILGKLGVGAVGQYLNKAPGSESELRRLTSAPYTSGSVQQVLPPYLQYGGPATQGIQSGLQQLGQMIQNPGALAPNVSEAIAPRLAAESQSIGANFRNLQQENAGAAARSNAPVSLKNAISSALGIAQERAQRESRMQALTQSDQLRRQDLGETYKMLDAILQYLSSARGQAIQGLGAAAGGENNRQAAMLAMLSSLAGSEWPSYLGDQPGQG